MTPEKRAAALASVYPDLDGERLRSLADTIRQAEVDLLRELADALDDSTGNVHEALFSVLKSMEAERSR